MSKYTFLFLFGIFFFVSRADATDTIIISEIAWMGTSLDSQNEWVELYNPSSQDMNLDGWAFVGMDAASSVKISKTLSGTIPANGFFLLERTDNETVPNVSVPQEQIYSGSLLDAGENIELKNNTGQIIDSIYASTAGWPAGDKTSGSKKPMERTTDGSWTTSATIDGTPQNTLASAPQPPPPPPTEPPPPPPQPDEPPPPSSTEIPSAPETTPDNTQTTQEPLPSEQQEPPAKIEVYLSELIPNPLGADSDLEFIEIVNLGDSVIDLSGWTITDPTKIFVVGTDTLLEPKKYLVFFAHETHINLNNDGDTIKFFDKNNALKDAIQYGKTKEGFSLVKIDGSWLWTQEATPGEKNKLSASSDMPGTEAQTIEPNAVAIATAPDINEGVSAVKTEKSVSVNNSADPFFGQDDNEQINRLKAQSSAWLKSKNFLVLSLALLLGFLGGFAVFIIRKKLRA
ncbi:MAG: hypothetical protein A3A97_00470 [Candidatus Terrybacteria bacterium RIFCSPLOWO2_01_FULL_40_23]|uniref:LTD domain-containing protein n=1 Tax=Candidatus Terrybacteria bacterium RIFCSPLOWO2_01_FULL_40_23 TaxID=1802366 RepID=A0A1G2PWW3_9BACT|nr:MAG: hypothetical protein A3A97_00470 [Candidatus Terrybacteria bacterium RIFCSPLOWO2_01_FULL_40_23]